MDEIWENGNQDYSGFMLIGDDDNGTEGPNSTGGDRFVYMAFHCEGGCTAGTMRLIANEPGDTVIRACFQWWNEETGMMDEISTTVDSGRTDSKGRCELNLYPGDYQMKTEGWKKTGHGVTTGDPHHTRGRTKLRS